MVQTQTASCPDAPLFVAFLQRDPRLATQFFKKWQGPLEKAARRHLKDFPADLVGDVVSTTWVLLLEKGPAEFDPTRHTVKGYLYLKLRQAAQSVRDDYTDGPREEPEKGQPVKRYRRRVPPLRLDAPADSSAGSASLADTLVDKELTYKSFEDRAFIRHVAEATGSYQVGEALTRVYDFGETPSAAAKAIGMTHTTLSRKLERYAETAVDASGDSSDSSFQYALRRRKRTPKK